MLSLELHEKLQELRKQKGLTQEELAEALYVSRTAISKWESGRGVPNIESLKAISRFYSVSLDDLLSGDELLSIAEDDHRKQEQHTRDLLFGLLDCGASLLLFLPLFGQSTDNSLQTVSLLGFSAVSQWLRTLSFLIVGAMALFGVLTLALQNYSALFWCKNKGLISMLLNIVAVFLFILCRQPYAAAFVFVFLVIKTLLLLKRR